jgi:hypothetical protein
LRQLKRATRENAALHSLVTLAAVAWRGKVGRPTLFKTAISCGFKHTSYFDNSGAFLAQL